MGKRESVLQYLLGLRDSLLDQASGCNPSLRGKWRGGVQTRVELNEHYARCSSLHIAILFFIYYLTVFAVRVISSYSLFTFPVLRLFCLWRHLQAGRGRGEGLCDYLGYQV